MLGPESERAKARYDNAAQISELNNTGTFTTSEDTTPGRCVDTRGAAGYTAGQGYGR